MEDYTKETQSIKKSDVPLWKREELWKSPFAPLLVVGWIASIISYGIFWLFKWLLFSWMRPLSNSKFFCDQGFHKYRKICDRNGGWETLYRCKICNKEKITACYE
jgi:hypothetical protein